MMFRFSVISTSATYQLASNVVSATEGNQIIITLSTTGVQNGQPLPFTISGDGITVDDFVGLASLTGEMTIQNGSAVLVLNTNTDTAFEPTETITITMDDSAVSTTVDLVNAINGTIFDSGNTVFDSGVTYWDIAV